MFGVSKKYLLSLQFNIIYQIFSNNQIIFFIYE